MNIIKYLQDPQLVADFQSMMGVKRVLNHKDASITSQPILEKDEATWTSLKDSLHSFQQKPKENCTKEGSKLNFLDIFGDGTVGGDDGSSSTQETLSKNYIITNWFWYNLFYMATKTGDEIFYIIFFPFWNWNIDGAVLRRVLVIWMITMYIGQALKDILKIPRPSCPPVVRLDEKWGLEYGLPSTHAMVGYSIPFSILTLSVYRYKLDWHLCFAVALVWCLLVCASRLYLGMHSVLDIVSGLILISGLLAILLPVIDSFDHFMLSHPFSPILSLMLTVAMVVCYPNTDRWTPARGDTTVIVGVGCGCLIGSWLNYQLGIIREPSLLPPYSILWPSLAMVCLSIVRTCLGLGLLVAVRAIFKALSLATICAVLQVSASDYKNKSKILSDQRRLIVELFYKFITYVSIGLTIVFTGPLLFRVLGIERPTYYTEI